MHLEEVIWPCKYALMILGLWTDSDVGMIHQICAYFRLLFGVLAIISLLVPELMTVVETWCDVKILGDHGALAVAHLLLVLKMLYIAWRQKSFNSMYQYIEAFWNISEDPEERQHYERMANYGKLASIVCALAVIGDFFSFEAVVLAHWLKNRREISEGLIHRRLPFELYYGFDAQRTPAYEIMMAVQAFGMIYAALAVIGCDCTMMTYVIHVSGQFRLIGYQFLALGQKIWERKFAKDELDAAIGKYVVQHQRTVRVAEELNVLLSPVIFGQIVTSGLEICLAGYAVIEGDNNGTELIKFCVLLGSMLCQLVFYCAPAESLIHESIAVADAIYYDVPWFTLTPKQQRDLSFVMLRAQKGCQVTALYRVMSIGRLTEVFNAAASYMALLRSMKK